MLLLANVIASVEEIISDTMSKIIWWMSGCEMVALKIETVKYQSSVENRCNNIF